MLVIGIGLIGAEIVKTIYNSISVDYSVRINFSWSDCNDLGREIETRLCEEQNKRDSRVEIFWCAGKAGFFATDYVLEEEYKCYQKIVRQLFSTHRTKRILNIVSSAGGIYEGSNQMILKNAEPCPVKPYGQWKLKQEQFIQCMDIEYRIYRLTSVYGLPRPGIRTGLLSVLISKTLLGKPITIHAKPDTLRDYVYVGDVARKIISSSLESAETRKSDILALGRPVSVYYLIQKVNHYIGKVPRVHFVPTLGNEKNIIFSADCTPDGWYPRSIDEGIALMITLKKSGALI